MNVLPGSWVETEISELGMIVSGGTPSTKVPDFWGGDIIWYSPADLTGYTAKFISRGAKNLTQEGLENSSAKLMPAGSVMFSSRAPIGYVAITSVEAATNQGFKSLVPSKEISADYVYHYLKSAKQMAEERASGTTFLELSGRAFSQLPVPVPPLSEQRRIVDKIETLFAELDKGEESLQAAKARAGLYRQSLLKHAFEGHLTADWRAANPDKLEDPETLLTRIQNERAARYKQALDDWQVALEKWRDKGEHGKRPQKPRRAKDHDNIPEEELKKLSGLPESWCWVELGHLTWSVKDGPHYSPKYSENGIPFISGGNIRPEGIDFDSAKYISKELHEELSQRCKPELGDVLYTKGGTTGIARVNTYDFEFNVWVHVAVLKITASTLPFYLQQVLNSPFCYQQSQSFTHGVGNQDLGLTRMVNIRLPLCSVDEQAELVKRLEAKLSTLNHLENQLEEQLARSKALRQSILKRAFAGELIDQDPNDEPASELLERIKAEKAEAELAAKRDRKTKPVRKPKNRRPKMTDLIEVLRKEGDWVSASKAAQGLGIADGTSSDDVEAFYRQLKERIEAKEIEVERRGDEDWLRLAKVEAT